MNPRLTIRSLWISCILAGLCGEVVAQSPAQEQLQEEMIRERVKQRMEQERKLKSQMFPESAMPLEAPMPFQIGEGTGIQRLFPFYGGIPNTPRNVPGSGGFPGAGAPGAQPGGIGGLPLRRVTDSVDRWPSWIDGGDRADMKSTPEQAVLVRVSDRVWFRAPNDSSFVPLAFYDRFRFMVSGTEIQVRGRGEFQVILHSGGTLRSRGPCEVSVSNMDSKEVAMELGNVDRMWIKAGLRPFRVVMPDATLLSFSNTLAYIERKGDRCHVANLGKGLLRYSGAAGDGELKGPKQIRLWMQAAKVAVHSRELNAQGGVATSRNGEATKVVGARGGQVAWSGALFRVGEGATLEIKPLRSNTDQ